MTVRLPVDPLFPAMNIALDPSRMAPLLANSLSGAGFPVSELVCTIERTRHKAGRKLLIGCRLQGRDRAGQLIDQLMMVSLWPGGDANALPEIERVASLVKPVFGPAFMTLDKIGGSAWLFPNDRKLHHIDALLNNDYGHADVVHYVPEQGCTVRVAAESGPALFGKCRADGRGTIAASVYAVASPHASAVRLAPIVSHDPDRGLTWQQEVAGLSADPADIIVRPHHWSARMDIALRDFHALPAPDGLAKLTIDSLSETFARRCERTAKAIPFLSSRIRAGQTAILARRPDARPLVLSHCDLHPGNLLWDGERFAIIDLDTAALAPVLLDYATLAGALIHRAIELNARDTALWRLIGAMRVAARRADDDAAAFDIFLAACLIGERLYRCTTRLKSPRACVRDRLLAIAEALVAGHA